MGPVSLHRLDSLNTSNDFQYIYSRVVVDTPLVWFNTEVNSCKDVIVCFCPSRYTAMVSVDLVAFPYPWTRSYSLYLILCLYPSHGMEKHLVQEELEEGEVEGP